MHHLSHEPDSGHVLERIHAGRQALLGSMHNRLIRRAHLVDMHDERRKERINATGHVSITRAWNQTNNLHEGGGKAEFVMDATTKLPVENAEIDIWQASTNGLYEQQDDKQQEHNLRGKFRTGKDGEYGFYCIRPTPYPVPDDGPAGELLGMLDRHPFRPAHIHLIVSYGSPVLEIWEVC